MLTSVNQLAVLCLFRSMMRMVFFANFAVVLSELGGESSPTLQLARGLNRSLS